MSETRCVGCGRNAIAGYTVCVDCATFPIGDRYLASPKSFEIWSKWTRLPSGNLLCDWGNGGAVEYGEVGG